MTNTMFTGECSTRVCLMAQVQHIADLLSRPRIPGAISLLGGYTHTAKKS